jgi:hypothetical protein
MHFMAKIGLSFKRVLKYVVELVKSAQDCRVCLLFYVSNAKVDYEQSLMFQNFE